MVRRIEDPITRACSKGIYACMEAVCRQTGKKFNDPVGGSPEWRGIDNTQLLWENTGVPDGFNSFQRQEFLATRLREKVEALIKKYPGLCVPPPPPPNLPITHKVPEGTPVKVTGRRMPMGRIFSDLPVGTPYSEEAWRSPSEPLLTKTDFGLLGLAAALGVGLVTGGGGWALIPALAP